MRRIVGTIVTIAVIGLVLGALNTPEDRLSGAVVGVIVGAGIGLAIAVVAVVVSGGSISEVAREARRSVSRGGPGDGA